MESTISHTSVTMVGMADQFLRNNFEWNWRKISDSKKELRRKMVVNMEPYFHHHTGSFNGEWF